MVSDICIFSFEVKFQRVMGDSPDGKHTETG